MDSGLSGLTALITGASGGIGAALARAFFAEGCNLVLHAFRSRAALDRMIEDAGFGARAIAFSGDVDDPEVLEHGVQAGIERFGRVDACVANAGVWPPQSLRIDQIPIDRARATLGTNLLGAMWTARAFFAGLARTGPRPDQRGASLCFIGSTAGRFGEAGHADYSVTKAGMHGLVRSLKNEIVALDRYGRVNVVEPGWTVTEMARPALENPGVIERALATMPVRQLAVPEDIANAVVWLASPRLARHVSGEIVTVAGGMEGRQLWQPEEIGSAIVRARIEQTGGGT